MPLIVSSSKNRRGGPRRKGVIEVRPHLRYGGLGQDGSAAVGIEELAAAILGIRALRMSSKDDAINPRHRRDGDGGEEDGKLVELVHVFMGDR